MTMTRRKRSKRLVGEHFRADGEPKRRFDTREQAYRFAQQHGLDLNLFVYPCSFCGGWHFASRRRSRLI